MKTKLHKQQQTLFELVHHDGPGGDGDVVGGVLLGVCRSYDGHEMVPVTGRHLGNNTLTVSTKPGHSLDTLNAKAQAFNHSGERQPRVAIEALFNNKPNNSFN